MATIELKTGEVITLTMDEVRKILSLQATVEGNIFTPIVQNKPLNTRKVDTVADNRARVPYAKMGKRAKAICDTAKKHAPNAGFIIEYPKKGAKGNGWIWLHNDGEKVAGLSPKWKWSKRRKAHYYDLNPTKR